jgi:peptidoglycan hydrolase CwlO-like protein
MKLQEQYDALDKEILQAVKERKFDLKDEKVKVQKRIAYLLSLEKEIEDSDKKILKGSKE